VGTSLFWQRYKEFYQDLNLEGEKPSFFNPHSVPLLFVVNSLILGDLSAAIQSMLLSNLNACEYSGEISDFKLWLAICSMCMTIQLSHIERANNLK